MGCFFQFVVNRPERKWAGHLSDRQEREEFSFFEGGREECKSLNRELMVT